MFTERLAVTHTLDELVPSFQAVAAGLKCFTGRMSGERYQVGDFLHLREYDADKKEYTGNECMVKVTYKIQGDRFGLIGSWCTMSIQLLDVGFNVRNVDGPHGPMAANDPEHAAKQAVQLSVRLSKAINVISILREACAAVLQHGELGNSEERTQMVASAIQVAEDFLAHREPETHPAF